jgi:hypothetical protein
MCSPLRRSPSSHIPVFPHARPHESHMDLCLWPKSAPVDPIIAYALGKKMELISPGCYEKGVGLA